MRFDVQTYIEPWTGWILGFNLDLQEKYLAHLVYALRNRLRFDLALII